MFGALPPPGAEWRLGKSAELSQLITQMEHLLFNVLTLPNEKLALEKAIEELKKVSI